MEGGVEKLLLGMLDGEVEGYLLGRFDRLGATDGLELGAELIEGVSDGALLG